MNQEERNNLGKLIATTAVYYQRQLTKEVVSMMVDDLSDLPFESVSSAFLTYRRNPKNKFFPLPAQIRDIIDPLRDPKSESRDSVEMIKLAISKFGYMRGEDAKAFIGEVGWRIVQGLGGWMRVCESNFIHNSALIAQAIARGEDLINFQGNVTTHAQLEHEEQKQISYEGDSL